MSKLVFKVKNTYKSLLYLGKDYPTGYTNFRNKVHDEFMKNKNLTDEREIKLKLHFARYMMKEVEAMYKLKKYRAMKQRYYDKEDDEYALTQIIENKPKEFTNNTRP